MRIADMAAWSMFTAVIGLAGCATNPSREVVVGAGRVILDRSPLCVLAPPELDASVGEHQFVETKDREALAPFLEAGLLRLTARPEGLADDPARLWYEVTPYGHQLATDCLTNEYSYPVKTHWGFRIGTPEIMKTYPLTIFTRHECFTSAGAMVEYRMKLEPWFVPGRFRTNFAAGDAVHYYDAIQNVGRAHVPFTKMGGRWTQQKIALGAHSTFDCMKLP